MAMRPYLKQCKVLQFIYSHTVIMASCDTLKQQKNEKSAQRDANTARALAVVRFGHRPPARCKHARTQTGPITIHCAAKVSVQCNNITYSSTSPINRRRRNRRMY